MGFAIGICFAGLMVALYLAVDRKRYRGRTQPGARPTAEVFRDPSTGERMRVFEDPATGAREYRKDPPQ